ncbi:hypothetical protein [Streptomyces cyslabdanicus]
MITSTGRPTSPGEVVTLPAAIGAEVTLDVGEVLKDGETPAT